MEEEKQEEKEEEEEEEGKGGYSESYTREARFLTRRRKMIERDRRRKGTKGKRVDRGMGREVEKEGRRGLKGDGGGRGRGRGGLKEAGGGGGGGGGRGGGGGGITVGGFGSRVQGLGLRVQGLRWRGGNVVSEHDDTCSCASGCRRDSIRCCRSTSQNPFGRTAKLPSAANVRSAPQNWFPVR